jgi:serine O-acetyltransferase
MKLSLAPEPLAAYVGRQLAHLFPDGDDPAVGEYLPRALERLEQCFRKIRLKYYFDGEQAIFNHLHTDQYATFLYFLSNTVHRLGGPPALAAKLYAANKALHALDIFYEVEMPDVFALQHPVGTVIGRGKFSNYLFVYQRCSVGANLDNRYPTFGEGVVLFGGASVIGDCTVGDNVWLSVGAGVMDEDVPGGSVVFGRSPELVVKGTRRNVVRDMFLR